MLRKSLVWLRKAYNTELVKTARLTAAIFAVSAAAGVAADVFLPAGGAWNILRSLLLVPIGCSMFAGAYWASLAMHNARMRDEEGWVPFRLRFPVSWRRRIAAIIAAVAVVVIYGMDPSPLYTVSSSAFVALFIALAAFVRMTSEERTRAELEIPDMRDVQYRRMRDEYVRSQLSARAAKKARRKQG